jgi:superfamily II DNA or RNA helicase
MPSFFETHSIHFDPWATNAHGIGLRNCQLGAYWAVWSHFTSAAKPALVSLPTGAGKTALMMALSFGLKASRVLIITPAATLRDQTAEKFRHLDDLRSAGSITRSVPSPTVRSNTQQLSTRKAWLELRSADVVVATPKTTSRLSLSIRN